MIFITNPFGSMPVEVLPVIDNTCAMVGAQIVINMELSFINYW
jgi:hypothetical protein